VLWTGTDLFMGFVIGPILRKVGLSVRREIIVRLVPRTVFLMPTLSIITGTTGWFLAKDLGLLDVLWPRFGRVAAALALVVIMTIQGLGYLLQTICGFVSSCADPIPTLPRSAGQCAITFLPLARKGRCRSRPSSSWPDS
jgi:hypothetical protein